MIKIESKKNKFTYNVYHVTKAFYPKEDIVQTVDEKQEPLVKIHCRKGLAFPLHRKNACRQKMCRKRNAM
jgi:oxygen-independent coproporphyrinogen-3 oxidase